MNIRTRLLLASAVSLLAASGASAQSMRFSDIDTDGDGLLSLGELRAAFGTATADRFWARAGSRELSRDDVLRINAARDDNDDDDDGFFRDGNDDDGNDDDDDDDGRLNDDDDDEGGRLNDDDDDDDDDDG